jgi:[protein-PII] uridylyltransferase
MSQSMITPNEHALEIAARALREKTLKRGGESIEIFRGFRKVEEHRLRMWHHAGAGGREVARQRCDLVDILFKELFEGIIRSVVPKGLIEPLVVTALGGYGRRELTPFSDVDIMFVTPRSQPSKAAEEIIRKTLMTLWDIGYKVGHSTRSIAQTIKQANGDMITKTSLLESRYLSGDRDLFAEFKEHFESDCVRGREGEYVSWRLANQAETRSRYGGSVFMQEPNVKNGVGGLRDYHSLLWISYFKERINTTAKLVERRFLRDSERRALEKSYDFLLRVRTEMHYLTGRSLDGLTLQLQGRVAAGFNFPQRHILLRVEAFMREYFSHARNIHLISQSVIERMNVVPEKSGLFGILRPKIEKFDGFVARGGKLYEESRETFAEDPYRLIRAFHHAQVRQLNFSTELRDFVRRRLRLVDRTFQYARVARETFLAILSRKGEVGRILREMHDLGFLGRYIPEFGALTCLVQHEFYHRYTADEHTLVCIEKLDGVLFADEEKFRGYRAIFQKLEDPAMLYLALLLHDTGKAANKRHHEDASAVLAQKVARRLQLSPERRRMLITLVNSHYEISFAAQKRNLDDPATIAEFAGIVGNRANLDALMLLTLADGQGTSDQNWSDWKEGLVWILYRRATDYFEGGRISIAQFRKNLEDLREAVSRRVPKDFADEIEAHFEHMPERYFQMFDSEQVAGHVRLFRTFLETHLTREDPPPYAPVFKWIARPEQGHSEVWVCGWNRPRLLERIAGAFLSAQINILSADVFTRGDNLALDIFRVCSTQLTPVTSARDITRVETRLCDSLAFEDYDFSPLLNKDALLRTYRISQEAEIPTKIVVDNTSHPSFTLIDLQTPDRLGLLYDLLRALGEADVNIELSRITTEMDVAMDTFYVTDGNGKITDESAIKRIQRLLQRASVRSVR